MSKEDLDKKLEEMASRIDRLETQVSSMIKPLYQVYSFVLGAYTPAVRIQSNSDGEVDEGTRRDLSYLYIEDYHRNKSKNPPK